MTTPTPTDRVSVTTEKVFEGCDILSITRVNGDETIERVTLTVHEARKVAGDLTKAIAGLPPQRYR